MSVVGILQQARDEVYYGGGGNNVQLVGPAVRTVTLPGFQHWKKASKYVRTHPATTAQGGRNKPQQQAAPFCRSELAPRLLYLDPPDGPRRCHGKQKAFDRDCLA